MSHAFAPAVARVFFVLGLIGCLLPGWSRVHADNLLQVVDLLPGSIEPSVPQKEMRRLSWRVGDIVLNEPGPELLQALQWALPDPQRERCYEGDGRFTFSARGKSARSGRSGRSGGDAAPSGDNLPFSSLLDDARKAVLEQELTVALEALERARMTLPCSDAILPREQLRALYLHEGVAHFFLKDGKDSEAFMNVLAIDPTTRFDTGGYPTKVRKAFEKVELKADRRRAIRVVQDLEDVEVYLDGVRVEGETTTFFGWHLVQLKGPAGRIRSQLIAFPGATEIPLSEVVDVGLRPLAQVREVLTQDIRSAALDRFTREGLEDYLSIRSEQSLLFAVAPTEGNRSHFRAYVRGDGMLEIRAFLQGSVKVFSRAESRGIRGRNPVLGVGASLRGWIADPSAFPENGRMWGLQVFGDKPLGMLTLGARLDIQPFQQRLVSDPSGCIWGSGCGTLRVSAVLAGGVGLPVYLTDHLRLTPGLYLEGAYVPELALSTSSSWPSQTVLVDILAGGPVARVELTGSLPLEALKLEAGLELLGGLWAAPWEDQALLLFPLGMGLRGGLVF